MLKTVALIPLVLLLSTAAVAQEGAVGVAVEKAPMKVTIAAKGRIEAKKAETVLLKPYGYRGGFVVEEVVEAGAAVKAGDIVLRFRDESLREAVDDARFDFGLAEEEHRIALERFRLSAESAERELVRREREVESAERRSRDWATYDKPRAHAYAELDRKQQDHGVDNAKEELRQLEMMYGEDELVDETEEIVLERSRHSLRRRLALRELWLKSRKHVLEVNEPRKEEKLAQDLERRRAELRAARKSGEHSAEGRVMSEMRTIRGFEKRKRSLKRLEALLEGLTIRAPADGILLHGPLRGGASRRFLPGTSVNVAEGVVAIADPSSLVAVLFVPSKEMLRLAAGSKVEITPDVTGAEAIEAKIDRISALPGSAGFEIRCHLPSGTSPRLFGAALKASIILEQADDVLSVPSKCVLKAGGRAFCMVVGKDGLVPVKIGRDDGKRTEILGGLAEGDKVLPPPEGK